MEKEEELKLLAETKNVWERLDLLQRIFNGKSLDRLYSDYEKINSSKAVSLIVLNFDWEELDIRGAISEEAKNDAIEIACSDYIKNNFKEFKEPKLDQIRAQLANRVPRIKRIRMDTKEHGAKLHHVLTVLNAYPKGKSAAVLAGRVISYVKTGRL